MSRAVRVVAALVAAVLLVGAGWLVGHRSATTTAEPEESPSRVDVGFAQDMAAHHDQALLMASLALGRGGPAVRSVAHSILTTQGQEAGQLRGWLQLWHRPTAATRPMAWMGHATSSTATMPGMASSGELQTLYASSGASFDARFLRLMTRHHEGGIAMARAAEQGARLAVVRHAARAMQVEQAEEIAQMQGLSLTVARAS